jgi:hypothetical protein
MKKKKTKSSPKSKGLELWLYKNLPFHPKHTKILIFIVVLLMLSVSFVLVRLTLQNYHLIDGDDLRFFHDRIEVTKSNL